jgi:hypothetical protein
VAKLVFPAEVMVDLAQMIAADLPQPGARMCTDAGKHWDPFGLRAPAGSCQRVFLCTFRDLLNVQFAFFSAGSAAAIAGPIAALSWAAHGVRSIRKFE